MKIQRPARRFAAICLPLIAGATALAQSTYQYDLPGSLVLQSPATNGPPIILRQPASQVVSAGDNGSFSVVVQDTLSVTYQWRFNGSAVGGATKDALLLTNVTAASEGDYSVVVANSSGSVTSAPAKLYWDSVGDGLPDSWKIQYFGNITNTTAASDAPLHDGISNLQKFLDGMNPTNGAGLKPRLVLSGLNGSVSASPDLDKYSLGQQVTLTATPHPGFQFVGWSGDLLGTNNPVGLTMNTNKSITGVFSLPLAATLDATNITWRSGGDVPWFGQTFVAQDGTGAAQNGPVGAGQISWLEATVYMPSEGLLTFWSKRVPAAGSTLDLTINGVFESDVFAQFDWQKSTYYLTAGTDVIRWTFARGSGYTGPQPFNAYWIDQVATTPFPDPLFDSDLDGLPDAWEYKYFGGLFETGTHDHDPDGVDNRLEYLDGTDPTDLTSVHPRLNVSTAGGTVALSPALSSYNYLQTVNLTANASPGYSFVGWRGDVFGPTNPAALTMDKSKTVDANFALTASNALPESLDATNLVWTTGGDAPFFGQTLTTHDGVDAAQSPPLAPSQQSWFQTTVNGPGPLSFWWKADSSFGSLQFFINGVQRRTAAGSGDWQQVSFSLTNGVNTLRWTFVTGSAAIQRDDAGWIDQISFGTNVPTITSIPISRTVLQSSNTSFSVTASSSAPLSYRWQKNGVNLNDGGIFSGTTTSNLSLINLQTTDSGIYSVLVSTPSSTVSASASLTVGAVVSLAQSLDAASLTWTSGGNRSWFGQTLVSSDGIDAAQAGTLASQQQSWVETTVNGPGALNFWWKVNCSVTVNHFDCVIDGITNAAISGDAGWVPRSILISAGTHTVRWQYIQNSFSSSISQNAWLDQVSVLPGLPPTITAGPLSQAVMGGVNVTFSVTAAGTAPLSYQWLFNRTNVVGANSSILSLNNVQLKDAGGYSVIVTNALGKATSPTADLVVNVPPFIISQPTNTAVLVGTDATLTVVADGAQPLYYQWRKNGASISDATQSELVLANAQTTDSGNYTVVITNWLGSITSAVAQVSVGVPPVITTQPIDQTAPPGSTATFSVTATGTAPLFYQWHKNSLDIPGATSASLVLTNVQFSDQGTYYDVVVSNALGFADSDFAYLTVGSVSAPSIVVQPESQTVPPGGTADFSVTAFGSFPLYYQWLHYGTNIPGATLDSFTLDNVQASDAGPYSVLVTNATGSAVSQIATLTVGGSSFSLAMTVVNRNVTLTWNTTVGRIYQVQYESKLPPVNWSNLTALITATGSTLSASDQLGNGQRYYRVLLMPGANEPPSITVQPTPSQNVSPGTDVVLSVTATGSPPLTYQWSKNFVDLPGETSPTLHLTNVQSQDTGVYQVVVTNSAGSVTSDPAVLLVF